ncbi:MAG: RNA-binding protein [Ignavibacteriaceae bacterium]|jgi:RNA recognition motif-containing protein|nr:RNA-binding protein [Ignavibacteriaceae bacterium]MCW9097144.1 RNA-binding protein [Ignavibacteriaceae bacterium]
MVNTKLYVGNLPYTLKDSELSDTFKPHGNVISAKVITDKESGRSKGFGFVEMENENDANSAIKALNGMELKGRKLVVATAKAN